MPGALDHTFTDRRALASQYGDSRNYESRSTLYACIDSPHEAVSFQDWVLDRIPWTGTETVLDVGCGPGHYLEPLLARAGRVIGVDLSPGMARRVGERAGVGRAAAGVADALALPVRDASVDVVLAAHMLYHVPDVAAAVREFRRVLRPGGLALAAANGAADKAELLAVWDHAARRATGGRVGAPAWGRRFNIDDGVALLREVFGTVEAHRRDGTFRIPAAEPVVTWMESLRAGTEAVLTDDEWRATVDGVREEIEVAVAAGGRFVATQASGVLVARDAHKPAP